MSATLKRLLAVGTAAAVGLVGFGTAGPAQATTVHPAATSTISRAATWLKKNPASADDGYTYQIYNATGLAAASTDATAATLRDRVAALRDGAAAAVSAKPAAAAYLTILVTAMHQNPKKFGGVDLISSIDAGVTGGTYSYAYGQAVAIIALKRAGASVPSSLVTDLKTAQQANGAYGYEYGGVFYPDPDSTALAIQAFSAANAKTYAAQIQNALAWATKNQAKDGSWTNYSPVDTTALMATSFTTVPSSMWKKDKLSASYAGALSWLKKQQHSDGGFPNSSDAGTASELMATYDASFLLAGKALSTFSYSLRGYSSSPAPKISGTAKVGTTLTAKVGAWSPTPSVKYQWFRSGTKIAGATAKTYSLTTADQGKRLRVRLEGYGIGLKTVFRYSGSTAKVAKA